MLDYKITIARKYTNIIDIAIYYIYIYIYIW